MITAALAKFAIGQPASALSPRIVQLATAGLIDTLACALAGQDETVVRLARGFVSPVGGAATAGLWGQPGRFRPGDAAFVNGIAAHALDFDDNMPSLRGHPSTTILPAALAAAQACNASGLEALAAYVVGIEIAGKVGLAMGAGHYLRGFHPTATVGIYGATAAAARLFGLDAAGLAMAWGLAASQAAGLIGNFGTMAKPFHAGHAARCAIDSVLMVRSGMTANPAIFDGPRSVIVTQGGESGDGGLPLSAEGLGQPWEIEAPGLYVKQWPCCYCSHRPIAGLLELVRRHGIEPDEILRVDIGFPPGTDLGLIKARPTTGLGGKFSVEYTAAALLLDGVVNQASFTEAMLNRPAVQRLMDRCHSHAIKDDRRWSATVGYNDVAIETPRGRFALRVDSTPGSPECPLSEAELQAKFIDCATPTLGPERAQQVFTIAEHIAGLPSCLELLEALSKEQQ